MEPRNDPPSVGLWRRGWPWLVLGLLTLPAIWHAVHFPAEVDGEFPRVVRPNFSPYPPPAYRLAEPGDTIDRVAIYVSALAVVLAVAGLIRGRERLWGLPIGVSLAAFWYASNPFPTFDGWHGLAWRTIFDPAAPASQRLALATAAILLGLLGLLGLVPHVARWRELLRAGRERGVVGLLVAAAVLGSFRLVDLPGVEPVGYWPRWAFVGGLVASCLALIRLQPASAIQKARGARFAAVGAGSLAWVVLIAVGIELSWYHRPIDRLRAVVPGRIYMSAMPTARGLEVAHARHHFKTIINLFPEDTPFRSPRLPEELRFARAHGLAYYGSPAEVSASNEFLDLTLRLAQDPSAWPILIHCHACMDRTPAWVGIYKFVVEGRPLDEVFRFIESHRGLRPQATVTLLYNRVLPRLAPERCMNDPTSALLHRCAEGTADPYYERVGAHRGATALEASRQFPSLTPRR